MRILVLAAAAIGLSACAADPAKIAPVSISASAYSGASCSAARSERAELSTSLASLEASQRAAAREDTVNVLLWGLPTASLNGEDRSAEIASTKGQIEAIDRRLASC